MSLPSIQTDYRNDMAKYAEQIRRYNMSCDDIKLRGISKVEDTQYDMVHFSYKGEVHKLLVHRDTEDVNSAVKLRVEQIKEMYNEEQS